MNPRAYNVLFICTGNSVRSILAESILNKWGEGQFRGYSAGTHPNGKVNALVAELLEQAECPTDAIRSKSWSEFAVPSPIHFDFVITLCGNAADEVCPTWPGQPMTAHWGIPDPGGADGSEVEKRIAFRQTMNTLETRIKLFLSLPIATIGSLPLQERMDAIGRTPFEAAQS